MKHFLLLITLLFSTQLFSQTFTGNLTLSTQAEVDAFNYDKITGALTIKGQGIVNIDSLYKLDSLLNSITIDSTNIASLYGLRNVKTIYARGIVEITNNPKLKSVADLNGYIRSLANAKDFQRLEKVLIKNNPILTTVDALFNTENKVTINRLFIDNNRGLFDINLYNTCNIRDFYIQNNDAISKLILPNYPISLEVLTVDNNLKLDSILYIGTSPFYDSPSLYIKNNYSLRFIKEYGPFLAQIENLTIENNSSLENLNFIQNFSNAEYSNIPSLTIKNNKNLNNCCGIQSLLSRNAYSEIDISGNPFPCGNIVEVLTKCDSVARNIILGRVYIDVNENNHPDESDIFLENIKIESLRNGNALTHITDNSGEYYFVTDTGNYSIRPITAFANFKTIPLTNSVTHDTYGNIDTVNFKVSPEILVNDASIVMSSNSLTRPARSSSYTISYTNESGKKYNGTISLVLDPRLTFNSSSITPKTVNGNILTWDIKDLSMFKTKAIRVDFTASSSLAINDVLISSSQISNNETDVTPENNQFTLKDMVRASYDPNNKEVDKSILSPEEVQKSPYLYYTVHFQNIGNDTAFHILIYDSLDINLDWSTFDIVASSHDFEFEQINGVQVNFDFKDILLPDSNVNEEDSKGFISYKIKPKNNLVIGDTINNRASIIFDVNAPIVTNTTVTAIMQTDAGEDKTICQGESTILSASGALIYTWIDLANGANFTVNPNTTTTYYLKGKVGDITQIDSVTIFVNPIKETNQSVAISSGESFDFNGRILTEVGVYRDTLPQVNGCDSIVVLNLSLATSNKNNIEFVNSLKIYPNPTKNSINIDLIASKQADFKISFFGVDGRVLMVKDYIKTATINESFDLSNFATGMYYMKIESESQNANYSIVKQ
jgi:hypothetical protein